jgi:hypothetical protein
MVGIMGRHAASKAAAAGRQRGMQDGKKMKKTKTKMPKAGDGMMKGSGKRSPFSNYQDADGMGTSNRPML